jgi:antitoxin component of RelBE/YafQ-DinJ toxin-antitoxin module
MSQRTTIVLGPAERRAAKRLAAHWGVTPSEAIRRALMRVANEEVQEQRERKRRQRVAALEFLIDLSSGQDLAAELKALAKVIRTSAPTPVPRKAATSTVGTRRPGSFR